ARHRLPLGLLVALRAMARLEQLSRLQRQSLQLQIPQNKAMSALVLWAVWIVQVLFSACQENRNQRRRTILWQTKKAQRWKYQPPVPQKHRRTQLALTTAVMKKPNTQLA